MLCTSGNIVARAGDLPNTVNGSLSQLLHHLPEEFRGHEYNWTAAIVYFSLVVCHT